MPALKYRWLLLVGALGCDGPTLWVGALRDAEVDAAEEEPVVDASVDASATVRDAQTRDGGVFVVTKRCFSNDVCPREVPRCHSEIGWCTQCQFDRDCKQDEWCDVLVCKPKDDDRGPGGGSMGGAP